MGWWDDNYGDWDDYGAQQYDRMFPKHRTTSRNGNDHYVKGTRKCSRCQRFKTTKDFNQEENKKPAGRRVCNACGPPLPKDVSVLKVDALRAELAKRGLPTDGKKDDLVDRLEYALYGSDEEEAPAPAPVKTAPPPTHAVVTFPHRVQFTLPANATPGMEICVKVPGGPASGMQVKFTVPANGTPGGTVQITVTAEMAAPFMAAQKAAAEQKAAARQAAADKAAAEQMAAAEQKAKEVAAAAAAALTSKHPCSYCCGMRADVPHQNKTSCPLRIQDMAEMDYTKTTTYDVDRYNIGERDAKATAAFATHQQMLKRASERQA